MNISSNCVITLNYALKDDDGNTIDSTEKHGEPMVYLQGHNQMVPGFESYLDGKAVGDKLNFTVSPTDGYGLKNVAKIQRIPAKYLKHEGKIKKDDVVRVNTDSGVKLGTVFKVGKFSVDVDMNHPLAGKFLHFDVEILEIRSATEEEIAHGHVHDSAGCDH